MTTREFTPRLDRQITREATVTVEVPSSKTYAYDAEYIRGGNTDLDAGTWVRISDTLLAIATNDSNGLPFPDDLSLPANGVEVSWDGAAATILTITDLTVIRHSFTFQPISIHLTFNAALPAAGGALSIGIDTGGTQTVEQTVTQRIWAARRDFSGKDFSQVVQGALLTIRDTRYIVRRESGPWIAGDTFNDEDGMTLSVQGVQQIGRAYLELLARSGGL